MPRSRLKARHSREGIPDGDKESMKMPEYEGGKFTLVTRADLMWLPGFCDLPSDSSGQPSPWLNEYVCDDDGISWDMQWSCQCDDECAECGSCLSPVWSDWVGPTDRIGRALWTTLPEKGSAATAGIAIDVIVDGENLRLADGWIVLGDDVPEIRRCGPWPDFDAFMREKVSDLDRDATVYLVDGGKPESGDVLLKAAKIEGNRPVPGSCKTVRTTKSELARFCEKWRSESVGPCAEETDGPSP